MVGNKRNSIVKLPRKIYLSLIGFLLLIFFTFGYLSTNKTNTSNTTQETPVELEEVKSSELNPEELGEYYAVYKNPFVVYLRKALNAYLANDSSGVNISMAAVEEISRDGIISGLDAFDKSYYESKFVVLTFNESVAGGVDIQIMFQDKPDRIFYAWIYPLADGNYDLRGFNSTEYFDPERIKELNETYKHFLYDKEHAL